MNNYTHVIFKSNKCHFDMTNDYKKVICAQDININDILLIEHCYYQKKDNFYILESSIRFDKELFNGLYPREIEWKEEYALPHIGPEIKSLIIEKLNNNMFMIDDKYIIGNQISWFNHSNNP